MITASPETSAYPACTTTSLSGGVWGGQSPPQVINEFRYLWKPFRDVIRMYLLRHFGTINIPYSGELGFLRANKLAAILDCNPSDRKVAKCMLALLKSRSKVLARMISSRIFRSGIFYAPLRHLYNNITYSWTYTSTEERMRWCLQEVLIQKLAPCDVTDMVAFLDDPSRNILNNRGILSSLDV